MKKLFYSVLASTALILLAVSTPAQAQQQRVVQPVRMGIVNTKKCLETSKLGKQEQANFEKMKNQMESVLQDKERVLEEIEAKLNDDDYMDGISDETANELRNKRRNIRKDGVALQNQYMQTLQQANFKIVQKLTETIAKASAQVAQDPKNNLNVIETDEAVTYYDPSLDVSDLIIVKMDQLFDQEQKESSKK